MSGIAGIFNFDGRPVDRELLVRMTDALSHRGPDGAGHWLNGSVALGHRMLRTTPEALHEEQPLTDASGQFTIVLDGRVDNRQELRQALAVRGITLRSDTDAELVLTAYICWGEDCPKKILGDFAFAVWDALEQRLLCARDQIGIKPFYYYRDSLSFVFASEMQALFADLAISRRPNVPLIGIFLTNRYSHNEETLYEHVNRLPAGHLLVVEPGTIRQRRYWDIDPAHTIRYRNDNDYAEHFLYLAREAVGCRLRSSSPVAAMLSGGLDSTSVVSIAQCLYQDGTAPFTGFEALSIIFDGFRCDERNYIDAVVQKSGISARKQVYEEIDPSLLAPDQAKHFPDVFYSFTNLMFVSGLTDLRDRGLRVMLNGFGGDELLAAGFEHLTDMVRAGKFRRLIPQVKEDAANYSVPPWPLFLDFCVRPFIPSVVKTMVRPLLRTIRRGESPPLLTKKLLQSTDLHSRLATGIQVTKMPTRSQQVIYNGLFYGWNTMALEMREQFEARFSIESRSPLLDRRLVEFLIAVPEDQRWRGANPKFILRQAMRGILPEVVRTRQGKAGFTPVVDWELRHRFADEVGLLFQTSVLVANEIIDRDALINLFSQYRNGGPLHPTGTIDLVLCLELWYRDLNR